MTMLRMMLGFVAALVLASCGASTGSGSKFTGEAQIENYLVRWSAVPALQNSVPQGRTPLIFTFTSLNAASSNGVTEQDWEREAEKRGMGVSDVKSVVFGGSAYKGPDGALRMCTISATQRGLCRGPQALPITRRVAFAQRVLAQGQKCQWAGFDPNYNTRTSRQLGAEKSTLHVAAMCT